MGKPLPDNPSGSASSSASEDAKQAACCNGNAPNAVQHVFVYGNSRPDITPPLSGEAVQARRAWLLGGRLYSCNSGGVRRPTLRLEESGGVRRPTLRLEEAGHAVLGYTVSLGTSGNVGRLLDTFERREYSTDFYDREVVEVVTEGGERVQSYVYHCQEIDRSNPVQGGDWLQHLQH